MSQKALYEKLKNTLTSDYLKDISATLIDAYRTKNAEVLRQYADHLFPKTQNRTIKGKSLFLQLISIIHPDRLQSLKRDIQTAYESNGSEQLSSFEGLLHLPRVGKRKQSRSFDVEVQEEYRYAPEDFGFDTYDAYPDEGPEEDSSFDTADAYDFLYAVKMEHLGNLDFTLNPADLASLEGDLALGGYNMTDLDGLQYCRSITSLDLSDNNISNIHEIQFLDVLTELFLSNNSISSIDCLRSLSNLEIADLSYNDIEDFSALLEMDRLQFVNLTGNPLHDAEKIRELEARGVVVIF